MIPRPTLALVLALAACTPDPAATGTALVFARSPADVDRIELTISGPGIPVPLVEDIPGDAVSGWSAIIDDIPAGTDRTFAGEAFDGTEVAYSGQAFPVTVLADEIALVTLFMQETTTGSPWYNAAPRMTGISASSYTVEPGQDVSITVTAEDPDGDPLTWAWTAPSGSFDDPTSNSVVWTAPPSTGTVLLHVSAADPSGATATLDIEIAVGTGAGSAFVSVDLNGSPEVLGVVPSPTRIDYGETTYLDATATDPDGDPLTYAWEARFPCDGYFDNPTVEDPSFTLSDIDPPGADCEIEVTVTDGLGGRNTGTISVATGPGPCDPEPCGEPAPLPGELRWVAQGTIGEDMGNPVLGMDGLGNAYAAATNDLGFGDSWFATALVFPDGSRIQDYDDLVVDEAAFAIGGTSPDSGFVGGSKGGQSLVRHIEGLNTDWDVLFTGLGVHGIAMDPSDVAWTFGIGTNSIRIDRFDTTGLLSTPHGESVVGIQPGGGFVRELSGNFVGCATIQGATKDVWMIELDSAGSKLWSRTYDSGADETCEAVAVSGLGEIWVTGAQGTPTSTNQWIAKFSTTGVYVASTTVDLGSATDPAPASPSRRTARSTSLAAASSSNRRWARGSPRS
ncbi:MAG: hypothetical protein H6737_07080 [Alphaproteobacteria bacterium]|nr:hypothetical protein [Alphaproteobacteria bacterium]